MYIYIYYVYIYVHVMGARRSPRLEPAPSPSEIAARPIHICTICVY